MKRWRSTALLLLVLFLVLVIHQGSEHSIFAQGRMAETAFSCTSVDEIPFRECKALESLYKATGGSEWTNNDLWLKNNLPCTWYGINCHMLTGHVIHVWLPDNNLTGTIPSELGDLSLRWLNLSGNRLTGGVPPKVAAANITQLVLSDNQLTGELPDEIGLPTGRVALDVGQNQLSGPLPFTLGNQVNLDVLIVNNNSFTGPLPQTLKNLRSLITFNYSNTGLCEPQDDSFQSWLAGIKNLVPSDRECGARPWTLMYYFATDNNLDVHRAQELVHLQRASSNENANIVFFVDRLGDKGGEYGWFTPSVRRSIAIDEPSTGDPQVLTKFVKWSQANFPGEQYALILIDHANGVSGFGKDEHPERDNGRECGSYACLTWKEVDAALSGVPKLDIIYVAGCTSATIEVAVEIQEHAHYLVASQHFGYANRDHSRYVIGGLGINETTQSDVLAVRMANSYVLEKDPRPLTSSVLRLSDAAEVRTRTDALGESLKTPLIADPNLLKNVRGSAQHFLHSLDDVCMGRDDSYYLVDLWDVALKTKETVPDATAKMAANDLINTLEDFIVWNDARSGEFYEGCDWELDNSYGVSIHWPENATSFYIGEWLEFASGADWGARIVAQGEPWHLDTAAGTGWASMLVDYVEATNPGGSDQAVGPPLAGLIPTNSLLYMPYVGR